jgi:CAAX protease family protein
VVSGLLFTLVVVLFAYVLARLRLESGSIWPVIVCHAAWNAVMLNTFAAFTTGAMAGLWTGESGILTVLVMVVVVPPFVRGTWKLRRTPGERRLPKCA